MHAALVSGRADDSDSVFRFGLDSVRLDLVVIRIWSIRMRFRWDSIRIWLGRSRYDSIPIRFGFDSDSFGSEFDGDSIWNSVWNLVWDLV